MLPSKVVPLTGSTHTVDVGLKGQLTFSPNNLDAAVGDLVFFLFHKLNHTLTQSTMDPCTPAGLFDSGFSFFNPLDQEDIVNQALPFLVRDSEPTWFFCKQTQPISHCREGMVFGINVGDKISAFLVKAKSLHSSTTLLSASVFPSPGNKTIDSTSSSGTARKGPSNTSPFVSNAVKDFSINTSVALLVLLNIIGRNL